MDLRTAYLLLLVLPSTAGLISVACCVSGGLSFMRAKTARALGPDHEETARAFDARASSMQLRSAQAGMVAMVLVALFQLGQLGFLVFEHFFGT